MDWALAWVWNDNTDTHVFKIKRADVSQSQAAGAPFHSKNEIKIGETLSLPDSPADLVRVELGNGPVIAYSRFGNESEGYFALTLTMTVPILKYLAQQGDSEICFSIAILSDASSVYGGTYTKPDKVSLDFKGFRKIRRVRISEPRTYNGAWLTEILVAARTYVTSIYPLPHVIVKWDCEAIGGQSSTAFVDLDVLVDVAISAISTRLTLSALR